MAGVLRKLVEATGLHLEVRPHVRCEGWLVRVKCVGGRAVAGVVSKRGR